MKFYGKGVVWDGENNKRLCKFVGGVCDTDDKRIQAILIERGYKFDPEPVSGKPGPPKQDNPPVTADMSAKELREIGKELGLSFPANMSKANMAKAINEAKNREV
jgi:hypothetical protein